MVLACSLGVSASGVQTWIAVPSRAVEEKHNIRSNFSSITARARILTRSSCIVQAWSRITGCRSRHYCSVHQHSLQHKSHSTAWIRCCSAAFASACQARRHHTRQGHAWLAASLWPFEDSIKRASGSSKNTGTCISRGRPNKTQDNVKLVFQDATNR